MRKFLFFAVLSIVASVHSQVAPQAQHNSQSATEANLHTSTPSNAQAATGQITFHPNGGEGTMDPLTNLSEGDEFALPRNTFVRDGFCFVGWTNMANSNDPIFQDEYPVFNYYSYNSDLYAVWEPASSALQLTFDANGGTGTMDPIYVRANQVILVPPHKFTEPEDGYECKGYGETPNDFARYRIGGTASFTQSLTLYAFWSPLNGSIGGASELFKGQTVFFDGVTIDDKDWVTIDKDSLYVYAEWHEGCGWYDTTQDWLNFCWAGATSNAIHWWLDRNKEYVDRYRETHDIPEFGYYGKGKSDVFAYFTKYWQENEGCFSNIGFRWFINGIDGPLVQESARGHGGLFKDVFGETDLVETYDYSGMNRRIFNNAVADALQNHKMISIDESQMAGGHAITCWGFRFDNEGYVDRLYYTDSATPWNNSLTNRDLSLSYIDVKYDESQGWKAYMESSIMINGTVEHGQLPIISLYVYSLGTELWKEYFSTSTSIETVTRQPANDEPEEYYDLQGRRVLHPQKGFYITKSGKKVIIRE